MLKIYCPSCGLTSDSYITDDVLELAMKMTKNKVNDMIYDMFKDLERHSKNSMVKFKQGSVLAMRAKTLSVRVLKHWRYAHFRAVPVLQK